MTAILTTLLTTIASIAGALGSTQITSIITALTNIIPFLIQEFQEVVPIVQNIIAALKSNNSITADQLTALDALEAQYDADFEAAVTAYGAATPPAAQ